MGSKRTGEGKAACVIALPADFRLGSVADVKAELVAAFDAPAAQLDGAGVERVDTAALQLLVAFRREATTSAATRATWATSRA